MSLPRNLSFKDLMLKEPVDFKAAGEDEYIKYRRHRRRALDMEEATQELDEILSIMNRKRSEMTQPELEEALSMIQRLKKARALRRFKAKIKRGAALAKRRFANIATLTKRAQRAARNLIVTRITKGVRKGELPFARRAEIEKRMSSPALKNRIATIAKRLIPIMRKKEMARKKSQAANRAW